MVASRKGPWCPEEDEALRIAVQRHGTCRWTKVCKAVPGRTGKSCRLRWCNQLSPQVNHSAFTEWEDRTIIDAHRRLGNQWAAIARLLVGRTDNSVKNHWHAFIKKRYPPSLLATLPPLPLPLPPIGTSGTICKPVIGPGEDLDTVLTLAPPGSWSDKATGSASNAIASGVLFM